jgi:hypothetical protein
MAKNYWKPDSVLDSHNDPLPPPSPKKWEKWTKLESGTGLKHEKNFSYNFNGAIAEKENDFRLHEQSGIKPILENGVHYLNCNIRQPLTNPLYGSSDAIQDWLQNIKVSHSPIINNSKTFCPPVHSPISSTVKRPCCPVLASYYTNDAITCTGDCECNGNESNLYLLATVAIYYERITDDIKPSKEPNTDDENEIHFGASDNEYGDINVLLTEIKTAYPDVGKLSPIPSLIESPCSAIPLGNYAKDVQTTVRYSNHNSMNKRSSTLECNNYSRENAAVNHLESTTSFLPDDIKPNTNADYGNVMNLDPSCFTNGLIMLYEAAKFLDSQEKLHKDRLDFTFLPPKNKKVDKEDAA